MVNMNGWKTESLSRPNTSHRLISSCCLPMIVLALIVCQAPPVSAERIATRELRVGIAVSQDFKVDLAWKNKFRQRLDYASQLFDSQFKLRFNATVFWDWDLKDKGIDINNLVADLRSTIPLKDKAVDLVIGLARVRDEKDAGAPHDLDHIGRAPPFSGYVVLRYPQAPLSKTQEETLLVHELGHLFGAIHIQDPKSIMSPSIDRQLPAVFDLDNRRIVNATRAIDFKQGGSVMKAEIAELLIGPYQKLIKANDSYDFFHVLGAFYLKLGREDEALKSWKAAAAIEDDNGQIHLDLGVLYAKLGKRDQAIVEFSKAVDGFNDSNEKFSKASALSWLGTIYFEEGNYQSAHYSWARALVFDPSNMDIQLKMALLEIKDERYDDAIHKLKKLLKTNKDNHRILSGLGFAYLRKGSFQTAIDFLQLALEKSPGQSVHGHLSDIDSGQPSVINLRLGEAYLKSGNLKSAILHFQASCTENSTFECRKSLGEAYYEAGMWDQCVPELAGALGQQREDVDLYGKLGVCLSNQNEFQRAEQVFREGLKIVRDDEAEGLLHKNLGHMYLRAQQWDGAIMEFQQALIKFPNDAHCYYGLGIAAYGGQYVRQAYEAMENVLRIDPNHEKAKQLMAYIRENH